MVGTHATSQCTYVSPFPPQVLRDVARAPPLEDRVPISDQCVLKMADGLCTGDPVGNVIEKTLVENYNNVMVCETNDGVNDVECEKVNSFYIASASDKLFDKLCANTTDGSTKHEGFLPCEDDCRKKRCVDRYDSSESSDRYLNETFSIDLFS